MNPTILQYLFRFDLERAPGSAASGAARYAALEWKRCGHLSPKIALLLRRMCFAATMMCYRLFDSKLQVHFSFWKLMYAEGTKFEF